MTASAVLDGDTLDMNVKILIAGVAIAALAAGGASAAAHKKMHKGHKMESASSSKYAAPDQPIPYAQLDSYLASHGMSSSSGDMDKMAKRGHGAGKMRHHHMKSSSTMPSDTSAAPSDTTPATPPATDTPSTPPQ
jgi:hypothetical protein